MRLAVYLASNKISLAEFARRIGVSNRSVVHRYVSSNRVPRPKVMAAIARETDGAVQPNDFFATAAE